MKAQDLWAGHEYAYKDGKARGVETPSGASRVKLIKTERRQLPGNYRMSTVATVSFLNKETGEALGIIKNVRARDIFDWWIDYADRIADRERRANAAKEEERRIKQETLDEQNRLKVALHLRTGIPQHFIYFDNGGSMYIRKQMLKEWLNGNAS